ncbi:MAG: metallophosphoesterase family protein [Polyangiales bacterium]
MLLVADNQTQHLYGDPFWMRSTTAQEFIHTAVRPVQLDLYGQDLLKWVLRFDGDAAHGPHLPMIHLGDAINMSCKVEVESFFRLMQDSRTPWLLAPGNHDGYFFGNEGANSSWPKACERGGGPADRNDFLRAYLESLVSRYPGVNVASESGTWQAQPGAATLLDGIAWRVGGSPWTSFVVQLANISLPGAPQPAYALLLDTNQYEHSPVLIELPGDGLFDAGSTGSVLSDQLDAAERLLSRHAAERPLVVLMGHHPYGTLTKAGRLVIDRFRSAYRVPLYVSAHTHKAQYFVNGGSDSSWLELNLGSILDWSPEYRTLAFRTSPDGRQIELDAPQHTIKKEWSSPSLFRPSADAAWEAMPGSARYYLSFRDLSGLLDGERTQESLMNVALAEMAYSLEKFPTRSSNRWPSNTGTDPLVLQAISVATAPASGLGPKVELMKQLQAFDEERTAVDSDAHRDYRLQQALWASQRMHQETRVPDSSDSHIVYPVETP